jgi:hypothetical protein
MGRMKDLQIDLENDFRARHAALVQEAQDKISAEMTEAFHALLESLLETMADEMRFTFDNWLSGKPLGSHT